MHKQILGYIPANLLPAIVSFAMIYAYTRILTPGSFGGYTFVFAIVAFLQIAIYESIPIAVMRFYPAARGGGTGGCLPQGGFRGFLRGHAGDSGPVRDRPVVDPAAGGCGKFRVDGPAAARAAICHRRESGGQPFQQSDGTLQLDRMLSCRTWIGPRPAFHPTAGTDGGIDHTWSADCGPALCFGRLAPDRGAFSAAGRRASIAAELCASSILPGH